MKDESVTPAEQRSARPLLRIALLAAVAWAAFSSLDTVPVQDVRLWVETKTNCHRATSKSCSQVDAILPKVHVDIWNDVVGEIRTEEFKTRAINWLSGAVQIPTESYDDMESVGVDKRWEAFTPLHEYLVKVYPNIHSTLSLVKVNTYGLLYEWTGSDVTLKPLLLAAHQDVVPVDPKTVNEWIHPPYSGYFDGERIWGRGSSDDRSGLIGSLSAIETLIEHGFQPTRSVVLSFGFDEETSGLNGAAELAKALLLTYGEHAFAFIVDEGGGFQEQYGTIFATPGIAEKGYLDVRVAVTSPGGHSSVPPSHTSIGLLSSLLVQYESNPYEVKLTKENPFYGSLQCWAEHAQDLPKPLRKAIKNSSRSKRALKDVEALIVKNPVYKSLVGTTQAVDLIGGGVKVNALPESAWAVVNHRISATSSVDEVISHDTRLLKKLAKEFNLTYSSFGETIFEGDARRTLTLTDAYDNALEPAPITPTSGKNAIPYQLLSGTIKATFNAHRDLTGSNNIVVAPGMPTGNTDTRYYWSLSEHIFRYNHRNGGKSTDKPLGGAHTTNESLSVEALLEVIKFFVTLILNTDESKDL